LDVTIRPLSEADLNDADRIFRLAFGTFVGLPEPLAFMADADLVRPRWRTDAASTFGAWVNGGLAGSNFATNWGTVAFFGPLTVRPDLWDAGIGKRLMEPVLDRFDAWGTRHAGLFTFPHSQKHLGLYQRYGFWPRFLTAVMSKPVAANVTSPIGARLSALAPDQRSAVIAECRAVTDAVFDGLDVTSEIRAVDEQRLGDTLLLDRGGSLVALAVCHCGAGSEAGTGGCYVKFAAVRPSPSAGHDFEQLLAACEVFAAERALSRIVAGVNTARQEAYNAMATRGFRTDLLGVAMQRPNEPGYNRPGVYVIDDWR
jgi:GNAT superfamily N-acetyltransferase